jgi:lipoprotein-anchoring transpeptidase ErfK/SrfK
MPFFNERGLAVHAAAALFVGTMLAGIPGFASAEPLSLADVHQGAVVFDQAIHDQPTTEPPGGGLQMPEHLRKRIVDYTGREVPGTIIIDTPNTYLYLIEPGGKAIRYGIGVGRQGFTWSGTQKISRKTEWPDWYPPTEMISRQPYLPRFVAGGVTNPLGARALYLGNTEYRIHGTNQPETIGHHVSSGCIRMTNDDVIDLYSRVAVGAKVMVLPMTAKAQMPSLTRTAAVSKTVTVAERRPGMVTVAPAGSAPMAYARPTAMVSDTTRMNVTAHGLY